MPSAFTFRCPHCRKLLGASRSRVGTAIACPRCGHDLTVPEPDGVVPEPPTTPSGETPSLAPPASAAGRATGERSPSPPPAFEAFFPQLELRDDPFALRSAASDRLHRIPLPTRTGSTSGSDPGDPASSSSEQVPAPAGTPTARRNDVILPRTALILWSLIVLLSLVATFAAGLLAGHFLW